MSMTDPEILRAARRIQAGPSATPPPYIDTDKTEPDERTTMPTTPAANPYIPTTIRLTVQTTTQGRTTTRDEDVDVRSWVGKAFTSAADPATLLQVDRRNATRTYTLACDAEDEAEDGA